MSSLFFINIRNQSPKLLEDVSTYLTSPSKTDGGVLIGGRACIPQDAARCMKAVKSCHHKTSGRQFIHLTITPTSDQNAISDKKYMELAASISSLHEGHQSLFVVHKDTQHPHIHILLNTVNYQTGKKFSQSKMDFNHFRAKCNNQLSDQGFHIIRDSANEFWKDVDYGVTDGFDCIEIHEDLISLSGSNADRIDIYADPVRITPVWNPDYPTSYSQFSRYFYTGNEAYTTPRRYTSMNSHFQNPGNYVPTPQTNAAPASIPQYNSYVGTPNTTNQTLSIDVGPHLEVRAQHDTDLSYLTPILESMYRQSESVIEKAVNAGYAMSKKADAQNLPVNIHVDASPHFHVSLVEGDNTSPAFVDTELEEEDDDLYE